MKGPRAVLAALKAAPSPWERPSELSDLPVSEVAMAPRAEAPPRRAPELSPADVFTIRETASLSQRELAAILGIGSAGVGQLERGARAPRPLENDVLHVLHLALLPMVNAADRAAWARGIAALAQERGPLSAILQIFASGASWRAGGAR